MGIREGCTQGYWGQDQHLDSWGPTGYTPATLFKDVFDRIILSNADLTLFQAINPTPPLNDPIKQLALQATAALLNAAHPDINYPLTVNQVITMFQQAFDSNDNEIIEDTKDLFDGYNNGFCPLD